MAPFTFSHGTTSEPQSIGADSRQFDHRHHHHHDVLNYDFSSPKPMGLGSANPLGTLIPSPRFHPITHFISMEDPHFTAKPFECEFERVLEQERSQRNSRSSARFGNFTVETMRVPAVASEFNESGAATLKVLVVGLPVELWELVVDFLALGLDDDSYQPLGDLFSCALTCRAWAYLALPRLYRTHGYGVLMPKPATRGSIPGRFPVSRSISFYTSTAEKRMVQLWRTLLLSCFTASHPTSASRFTTFAGATLFPYIKYVQNLDTRTLVMVLSEIMKARKCRERTEEPEREGPRNTEAANYFFAGALGAFEISGATRGERMVVGGLEYEIQTPVWGKEVKLFVGDTALMMMDFLYPHLHHLKGFTIAELGQLRVSSPITMHHPASLLTSLSSLNSLVISSGWMVSTGLGRAIASIRPTILDGNSSFNLTILDWRFKTHYDPNYHHNEDWEASHEDYRYTVRSAADFFNALNPNSVSSLDLDFEVRYSRQQQGDLGDGAVAARQAGSLEALRIAHMRSDTSRLQRMFQQMGDAGFAPKALCLVELYKEKRSVGEKRLSFVEGMLDRLEDLDLVRFPGIFEFAADVFSRPGAARKPSSIKSLKISYTKKHVDEALGPLSAELFFLRHIPSIAATLTTLKLCDTDHEFNAQDEPRWRTKYNGSHFTSSPCSPLELLVNLRTLVLTGDISLFLIRNRLPWILYILRTTLTTCDICVSLPGLLRKLQSFLVCEKLQNLYLREWNWGVDEALHVSKMLTTEDVKAFVQECRTVLVPGDPPTKTLLMGELGIDGGLLQVAARQNWGEVQKWVREKGCKFYWSPQHMWRVGYVASSSGGDPTFFA